MFLDQSEEREKLILRLHKVLDYIDIGHASYISDYADLNNFLKYSSNVNLTPRIKKQVSTALNSKNLLRQEFETLYRNFKSMAKGIDNIPMKDILKHMQDCFNFNTNIKDKTDSQHLRYYDSTTMTMRIIK